MTVRYQNGPERNFRPGPGVRGVGPTTLDKKEPGYVYHLRGVALIAGLGVAGMFVMNMLISGLGF